MDNLVHLRSAAFRNVHLRLDGTGVVDSKHDGGIANCQFGAASYETFSQLQNTDGTISFESFAFPGVYLRLDATGIPHLPNSPGGHVNGQCSIGPWEKYRFVSNEDTTTSLLSAGWPNMFLRLDGAAVTQFNPSGAGTVNCEFVAGEWFNPLPPKPPIPPLGAPGPGAKFVLCECLHHTAANAALDKICALFPDEATQIEANRAHILNACCPPYSATPNVINHLNSLTYANAPTATSPVPADNFSPCVRAIANVALDAIGLLLSLFGVPASAQRNMNNVILNALGAAGVGGLEALMESLRLAPTLLEKARYLWTFVLQLRRLGVLDKVWGELRSQLRWWEWVYIAVVVIAQIAAWILTDGAGFVAEIVLILASLVNMSYDIYQAVVACLGVPASPDGIPSPA